MACSGLLTLTGEPALAAPLTQAGAVQRDVTYCTADGVALKMDVYKPASSAGQAPAVIYIHGGGWVSGDKREMGLAAGSLNSEGYVVFSVNYRLAPQYKWPAQINDVKCAVRSIRANATSWGIDPNRIGVWGSSAGGHLSALLGLTDPSAGFDTSGGYNGTSSAVQAVVDMFGPTDLLNYDLSQRTQGVGQAVFGYRAGDALDKLVKASPVTYVKKTAPPFLIIQGDKDAVVPPQQSQELHDKLVQAGADSRLVMVKNAGHAFVPVTGKLEDLDPSIAAIKAMVPEFFRDKLGAGQQSDRLFPETGKHLGGRFLQYWQQNGGLAQFGYPISEPMLEQSTTNGKTYTVQYFERAVFEMHPQNDAPNDVLLQLLGVFRYSEKYGSQGAPNQAPNASAGSIVFTETGKHLGGRFLQYWQQNGGLARQGLPLSDEFNEVSDVDGKTYRVQYFERAVFEYHPENTAPNDVLLSPLGNWRYQARYPAQQGTQKP
jgi:acetyl esterase/lipase